MLTFLLACSDYELDLGADGTKDPLPADSLAPPIDTTGDSDVVESCNGVDDDGDGQVDEGFADTDGDGVADCVETDCPAAVPPSAGPLPIVGTCATAGGILDTPVLDAFRARVAWQDVWPAGSPTNTDTPPLVVYLDDDNGDGVIGLGDGPEILTQGTDLTVIEGATGVVKRQFSGNFNPGATPVVGDVDGDGVPEIFVVDPQTPRALRPDGTVLWVSSASVAFGSTPFLSLADLHGDGSPELLADNLVLDAATGALITTLPAPSYFGYRSVAAADLDRDGEQEILLGGSVYRSDGSLWWSAPRGGDTTQWEFPVQADGDEEAEVVFVGDGFGVYSTDGTELVWEALHGDGMAGAPTAADFDGDGDMEVGIPQYYSGGFSVYELDGTELWRTTGPSRTLCAGSSAFDFSGDGSSEIIYPADEDLYIYDGATGDVLYTWSDHESPTMFEYATVADLDEDGAAEVILGSILYSSTTLLTVLEHDGDGWAPGNHTWGVYDYAPSLIGEDNRVPAHPQPAWLGPGVWRAEPAAPIQLGAPDLVVAFDDYCVSACDGGDGWITVQVGNQGSLGVSDAHLEVVAITSDGGEVAVASSDLGPIDAGTLAAGIVVELPPQAVGASSFRATVSHTTDTECDLSNDEAVWTDACP